MASTIQRLKDKGLISPPSFLPTNVHYETMMGSVAYGVSGDSSDMDIYGFCIPPKRDIFPHLKGEILGFGRRPDRFNQYQQHGVVDKNGKGKVYDITVFSIVRYFHLAMENNPNIIDSLFTPQFCVLHITQVGQMMREKRHMFLHKGCWQKFKGYAYSQLHKMKNKNPEGKRKALVEEFGFDVKYAYNVVRLLDECEQILALGDIDLQRNREQLKAIRRGDMSEDEIIKWASSKEVQLEKLYTDSKLPYSPDEAKIKTLLLSCLEEHYGNLDECITLTESDKIDGVMQQLKIALDMWEAK